MPISFENLLPRSPGQPASALLGETIRRRVKDDNAAFTLSDFVWDSAPCDSWNASCHVLNFALTPRPQPSWISFGGPQRYALGPLMFVPQGIETRSYLAQGRQRSLTCLLSAEVIERILGRSPHWDSSDLEHALNLRNPAIEQLLWRIARELERPGFASAALIEALGNALAIELIRIFRLEQRFAPKRLTGGLAPWRMRRIRERAHVDGPAPDLAELSEICGLSVRHLTRAFKAETGQTLASYVEQVVMDRARAKLAETREPIAEIAVRLGFASAASFCSAYRRHTGERPSDLRKARRAYD
ncbi:helix-turn-helix domain-containing protein [Novosphingobium sp. JCM 18896]|uniref:helix-turn-helix domain-containing protein n=1 Tax=Novosphingobium sp. JCM 18896 TaxID=2989731 RepID=UPI0022221B7A|nr:AraC family transcriptional regulator [Novosphingobium sp. JCM 18896]MCW1429522.1 helix-turn-helix transcriptional regulator [Novosphingobium sp. JCM 18896]